MIKINHSFKRSLLRSDSAAAAIEYSLLGAIVGLGILMSLLTTKASLNNVFSGIFVGIRDGAIYTETLNDLKPSNLPSGWSSKKIASINTAPIDTVNGVDLLRTRYLFADGSIVNSFPSYIGSDGQYHGAIVIFRPADQPNKLIQINNSNSASSATWYENTYAQNPLTGSYDILQTKLASGQISNGTTSGNLTTYAPDGSVVSKTSATVTAEQMSKALSDAAYFTSL